MAAPAPNGRRRRPKQPAVRTRTRTIICPLRPLWRGLLFFAPVALGSLWLGGEARRVSWLATHLDSIRPGPVQAALALEPGNAELLHRLGMIYSSNPEFIDLAEAGKCLRQAVSLSPERWDYWADLATACDSAGDARCADDAYARAQVLNPMGPRLQWIIGNHFVLTSRPEMAFPYFRKLLGLSPDYRGTVLGLCFRATRDPQLIYDKLLSQGEEPAARLEFLNLLTANGNYEDAMRIWEQMSAGPDRSLTVASVKPFLDFLIDKDRIPDALRVWSDLERSGAIPPRAEPDAGNLLRGGRFGFEPLNAGFDWHTSDSPNLVYDFTDASGPAGSKCLRIEFVIGENGDYNLLSQVVPVRPNAYYRATALVRSGELTSASGPRLRLEELGCSDCPMRTSDTTLGATGWHAIATALLTHARTQALRVSFWRPPAKMPPRDISGTVWLAEVALRAAEVSAAAWGTGGLPGATAAPGPAELSGRAR